MNCSSPYWSCDAMMYLPPQVNTALELLTAAGFEAYLVGGAVRDYLREKRQGHDWDITTSALPEEAERVFAGYRLIETGMKHGTVTKGAAQAPCFSYGVKLQGKRVLLSIRLHLRK